MTLGNVTKEQKLYSIVLLYPSKILYQVQERFWPGHVKENHIVTENSQETMTILSLDEKKQHDEANKNNKTKKRR